MTCTCGEAWSGHPNAHALTCAMHEQGRRPNPLITDHPYRPDRQGQWHTGRCDLCGEPKAAHLRCTCPVRSDAIGPHTRGCPNHPEAVA